MCRVVGGTERIGAWTRGTSIGGGQSWGSCCGFVVIGMLYAVLQVGSQHAGTCSVQVEPVRPEEMSPLPENVKVIDEAHLV